MKTNDLFDGIVVRPYNTWSDVRLSAETRKIQTSMFDNRLFPGPQPGISKDCILFYWEHPGFIKKDS